MQIKPLFILIGDYIHKHPSVKYKPFCYKVKLVILGEFQWIGVTLCLLHSVWPTHRQGVPVHTEILLQQRRKELQQVLHKFFFFFAIIIKQPQSNKWEPQPHSDEPLMISRGTQRSTLSNRVTFLSCVFLTAFEMEWSRCCGLDL